MNNFEKPIIIYNRTKPAIMRKILLLILFTSSLSAQTIEFSGGYTKSGLDFRSFRNKKYVNNEPTYQTFYLYPEKISTFNVNLGVEYINKKYYSLKSSIGYIKKGGYNPNNEDEEYRKEVWHSIYNRAELELLTVNTAIRLKHENKYFTPFFEIGPRFDYLIGKNEAFDFNYGDEIKHYFGIDIGCGLYHTINKFRIGTEFIYNYTINEIYENENEIYPGTKPSIKRVYSYSFNLTIGYEIN